MNWLKPAPGPISSPFGIRVAPTAGATTFHEGVDIAAPNGSSCVATAAGTVTMSSLSGGYGGLVAISHENGHSTRYAHLSRIDVHVGQQVAQGQQIGLTGGRIGEWGAGTSTGPHCHHEHRIHGTPVDPVPFWATTQTAGTTGTPITEEDTDMLRFIARTAGPNEPWYATNGLTKRILAPGENQLLVDLALAVYETDRKPKILGDAIDRIPNVITATIGVPELVITGTARPRS